MDQVSGYSGVYIHIRLSSVPGYQILSIPENETAKIDPRRPLQTNMEDFDVYIYIYICIYIYMMSCSFHVELNRSLFSERFSLMIPLNLFRSSLMMPLRLAKATSWLNQCAARLLDNIPNVIPNARRRRVKEMNG